MCDDIGPRIKLLRRRKNITQEILAEELGVTQGTVTQWETGRSYPSGERLIGLSRILNVPIESITGVVPIPDEAISAKPTHATAPVYGSIAAGTPIEDLQQGEDFVELPTRIRKKHPNAFFLKVKGESMNKLYQNGSLALIDPDIEFTNGAVCAVYVNGYAATIKRMNMYDFGVVLHPESYDESFKDELYAYKEHDENYVQYIGTVVWSMEDYRR